MSDPLVSIITPSYNQAAFLEATLRSVADQDYPRVEHIVIDGGSTDGSLEILERWGGRFVSEADAGQADAINKGVAMATGDICAWLNSDDVYLGRTVLSQVVDRFAVGARAVSGRGRYLDAAGGDTGPTAWDPAFLTRRWLRSVQHLLQPATFYEMRAARELPLDVSLHYAFDWDFFIRLAERVTIEPLPVDVAGYRIHGSNKSETGDLPRDRELQRVVARHHGRLSPEHLVIAAHLWGRGRGRLARGLTKLPARVLYAFRRRRGPIPV